MWELLKASFEVLFNAADFAVTAYLNAFKKFAKYAGLTVLICLPLPILGLLIHSRVLISLFVFIMGLIVVFGLIVSFPALWAAQVTFERFPSLRRTIILIWSALFWVLAVAIYFYIVPVWQNPEMVPLVILLISAIVVGSSVFSIKILPPKLVLLGMMLSLIWISRLFFFPETSSWIKSSIGNVDAGIKGWAERRLDAPKQVNPETTQWFDFKTGEPLLWFSRDDEGNFMFFDRKGYNTANGLPLKSADREIYREWKDWKKSRAALSAPITPIMQSPQGPQPSPVQQTQPNPPSPLNTGSDATSGTAANTPAPEQKTAPPENNIPDEDVIKFTEEFMRATERKDLFMLLSYYDDVVSYHDRGLRTKEYIKRDLMYFFNNWNYIKYQPVGTIGVKKDPSIPDMAETSYNCEFNVENNKKRIIGRTTSILKIKKNSAGLKVIGIKQEITDRNVQMLSN